MINVSSGQWCLIDHKESASLKTAAPGEKSIQGKDAPQIVPYAKIERHLNNSSTQRFSVVFRFVLFTDMDKSLIEKEQMSTNKRSVHPKTIRIP
jgi:hypothetical protein